MGKLTDLAPEAVFRFFEEICGIPHGSYHVDAISDHLAAFAKTRGLEVIQDQEKNIIVKLPASEGYEKEPVLILQGHMDMVAVNDDPAVDMEATPLDVTHDDEWVYAKGSSLGGDDGIAVAMMMALMDDPTIPHPALELVITTNEEVGMEGAVGLDASVLQGNRMLNLDSEDEGIFTVGCAGGVRVVVRKDPEDVTVEKWRELDEQGWLERIEYDSDSAEAVMIRIELNGLQGGHSGQMIHLGRANAIRVMARLMADAQKQFPVGLNMLDGGTADNAIPHGAVLCLEIRKQDQSAFCEWIQQEEKILQEEYKGIDDGLRLKVQVVDTIGLTGEHICRAQYLSKLILEEPDGVQAMSKAIPGLVETSLNCGIARCSASEYELHFELRSMVGKESVALRDKVVSIGEKYDAKAEVSASYPEWEYREQSPLRDKMTRIFREMYHKEPVIEAIHAGLECGVLAKKIEDFDAVSIGPDMQDIHTTKERLSIESVRRTWAFVLEILKEKD